MTRREFIELFGEDPVDMGMEEHLDDESDDLDDE